MALTIFEFELPDGTVLEIEADESKQAEATAKAKEYIAAQQTTPAPQPTPQPELTPAQKLTDIARSGAKGAVTSLIGLASLPSMAQQGVASLMEKMGATRPTYGLRTAPTYEQLTGLVEQIPGAEAVTQYQPQTRKGRFAESVAEFTTPPLGLAPIRALKVGGATGTVQQFQEELGIEGPASIPLTLLTGGISTYATDPNRAVKLAAEALKGVPQEKIDLAKTVEAYAESKGVKLTAPELIQSDILTKLGESVYNSPEGGRIMYEYIKNRPQQMQAMAENLFDNHIAKNPEQLKKVLKNANVSAKEAVSEARTERTLESQQAGYKIADDDFLDTSQVKNILDDISEQIQLSAKGATKEKLISFRNRFIKKEIKPKDETVNILDQYGKPIGMKATETKIIPERSIRKISEIYRETRDAIADSTAGTAKEADALTKNQIKKLKPILNKIDEFLKTNENYLAGTEKYKQLTNTIVEPTLESIEPFLIGKGVTASKVKNQIFGIENVKPADIRATYTTINKIDKQAFPNLARVYFDQIIDRTLYKTTKAGRPSFGAGFNLFEALAGTKNLDKNFKAVLSGVAEARGLNKNEVLRGFDKFNEILKRTATLANVDNPKRPPDAIVLTREAA